MPDAPSFDHRVGRLESSVARLTAMVEGLVSEWNTERVDLKSAIEALRAGRETRWRDIAPWIGLLFVLAGMAGALVIRENDHIRQLQSSDTTATEYRMDRNESILRLDHDDTVRNNERWRLWETGLLASPQSSPLRSDP